MQWIILKTGEHSISQALQQRTSEREAKLEKIWRKELKRREKGVGQYFHLLS